MYSTVCMKIENLSLSLSVEHQDTPLARKQGTAAQRLSSRFLLIINLFFKCLPQSLLIKKVYYQLRVQLLRQT